MDYPFSEPFSSRDPGSVAFQGAAELTAHTSLTFVTLVVMKAPRAVIPGNG
jgi:hypothetical protein